LEIDFEVLAAAIASDDCIGFCTTCGDEQYQVEPDAREYICESCGEPTVFGAEELLIMQEDI